MQNGKLNFPFEYQECRTLSKYNSVAQVDIIVIWHLSLFSKLSSFLNKNVLRASYKKRNQQICISMSQFSNRRI